MRTCFIILVTCLFQQVALGEVYTFSADNGSVEFYAKGRPALLKITGKGVGVSGILKRVGSKISGDLKFDLNSLETGIDLRNEHMKQKYLDVQSFPFATLYIDELSFPKSTEQFEFIGDLEIKNVRKLIKGVAKIEKTSAGFQLTAKFKLKITDYPLGVPNYLGVTVAEEVSIEVVSMFLEDKDIALNPQSPSRKKQ